MKAAIGFPVKPVKPDNFVKRLIERHQHKIIWVGMPLLCVVIWAMAITTALLLCR